MFFSVLAHLSCMSQILRQIIWNILFLWEVFKDSSVLHISDERKRVNIISPILIARIPFWQCWMWEVLDNIVGHRLSEILGLSPPQSLSSVTSTKARGRCIFWQEHNCKHSWKKTKRANVFCKVINSYREDEQTDSKEIAVELPTLPQHHRSHCEGRQCAVCDWGP